MKRNVALLTAAGLTTMIAIAMFVLVIAALIGPDEATAIPENNEAVIVAVPENSLSTGNETAEFEAWQAEIEATAQAANQQIEATLKEREAAFQTQIDQRQQNIAELDSNSQSQVSQLQSQLTALQAQIEQTNAVMQAGQGYAAELQQAIQDDATAYQNELAARERADKQLTLDLEAAAAQLDAAYAELALLQAQAPPPPPPGGNHHDDDDDDDDDDHNDSGHDDDDDDDHDDHDDDDDDDDHDDD